MAHNYIYWYRLVDMPCNGRTVWWTVDHTTAGTGAGDIKVSVNYYTNNGLVVFTASLLGLKGVCWGCSCSRGWTRCVSYSMEIIIEIYFLGYTNSKDCSEIEYNYIEYLEDGRILNSLVSNSGALLYPLISLGRYYGRTVWRAVDLTAYDNSKLWMLRV